MAETEKIDDLSKITVSAKVLGNIIGVGERRVRQLAEEGILTKVSSGRYSLQESLHGYILNLRVANDMNKPNQFEDELDLDTEKALHERVKRHMAELKYSFMKGRTHRAEDVEAVMTDMLANFKTKLLGLPSKLTPLLVDRKDKKYILDLLTNEFHETLKELSEYDAKAFYGEEYIESDDEEEEEDFHEENEDTV